MSPLSIIKIVAPAFALVAAGSAAVVFGVPQFYGQKPDGALTATTTPPQLAAMPAARASTDAAKTQDTRTEEPKTEGSKTESSKTDVASLATGLAAPSVASKSDQSAPSFDLARIEPSGDAVIAGRAAPGAKVELMRNGEQLDGALADASGQFVIVPPTLPAGEYELTLRAKSPDGNVLSSKQSVAVNIKPAPAPVKQAAAAQAQLPAGDAQDTTSALPASPSQPAKQANAASQPPRMALANAGPDDAPPARDAVSKASSRVVVRGDSLWRISRITYGAGQQYAIVYRANRNQIRDPNLIHPGQVLVLPVRQR